VELLISFALFTLLGVVTVAIVSQRNLVAVVILGSIYSFLIASVMVVLDAVDVALTEASVGAGISTVLLLAGLKLTRTRDYRGQDPNVVGALLAIAVGGALVWGSLVLPPFGAPDAPIHQHVAPRYIEGAGTEIGVPNIVTAVLADYRGFDTLGETTVVFVAGMAVLLLLRRSSLQSAPPSDDEQPAMSGDLVLRVGTKLILPFILLFALYVQFHGDYGPGGGFQAGVIAASAVILLGLTLGLRRARRIAPPALAHAMIPLGVLIFAGTGVATMLLGGDFLEYAVLAHEAKEGHHLGIMLVEAGVLVTVSGTMISLFYAFVERGR
jgi:multicomponent Na+:H+ antiporter subunit B